jgi:hypothetical protein
MTRELADPRAIPPVQAEVDSLFDRGVGWQEAESAAESTVLRWPVLDAVSPAEAASRWRKIALSCRALDVVRSSRCGCAAVLERASRPLVGAESPACGRRLVDRASHQRVPEAEASRYVGLAHEAELQELIEGLDCTCLLCRGGGAARSGSKGSPATAAPQHHT